MDRLARMHFVDADHQVMTLLDHPRTAVRFLAIQFLALVKSPLLHEALEDILKRESRWTYRFLTRILYEATLPVPVLIPLARSDNRDWRKLATLFTGTAGRICRFTAFAGTAPGFC